VIERAVILCDSESFHVDSSWLKRSYRPPSTSSVPLAEDLAQRERSMIEQALSEASGQISGPTGAAAKLGMPRQTLESKIRKLRINRFRFKSA
jgi:formate hydrogenlyase transcriptional activator